MKNIHVLPTDKPSRLFTYKDESYLYYIKKDIDSKSKNENCQNQNIYITSDEEIKEGDWCINNINEVFIASNSKSYKHQFKKIILTTDQDLIKDGVQAIDDEFLEWFVNNSSCEEVEIEEYNSYGVDNWKYLITVPKEETKQSIKDIILSETPESVKQKVREAANALVNKQETTLEEAKDLNYWKNNAEEDYLKVPISVLRYITELEKQQERSYSEEEVKNILFEWSVYKVSSSFSDGEIMDYAQWFKQFKKK